MACVLLDIKNAKLGIGRSSEGIEGYGEGPLWRRRPALSCGANDNEEEEDEEEEEMIPYRNYVSNITYSTSLT